MPVSFRRGPLRPQEFLTPKPGQPLGFYSVSVIDVATTTTVAATPTGAWAGTANDSLQGFPQGQSITADGPNTGFVAATSTGDWRATADDGRQGFPQGQSVIATGPDTGFVTATAIGDWQAVAAISTTTSLTAVIPLPVIPPEVIPGGGTSVFREGERFPGPPWHPQEFENDPLPDAPLPVAEPVFVNLRPDNTPAFIALFESGALTEDEFVALLAAA